MMYSHTTKHIFTCAHTHAHTHIHIQREREKDTHTHTHTFLSIAQCQAGNESVYIFHYTNGAVSFHSGCDHIKL